MQVVISEQAITFLYSVVGGGVIALIFDIFRLKRRAIKTRGIFLYIEDFLYWILVAFIMFAVLFYTNDGELRGYLILGILIGVVLYILLLSRLVLKILTLVIKFLRNLIIKVWNIVLFPIRVIIKIFSVPIKFILKILKKLLLKAKSTSTKGVSKIGHTGKKGLIKVAGAGKRGISKINIWKKLIKIIRKKQKD